MIVPEEKRNEYWDHFTGPAYRASRGYGVTDRRLERIKKAVMASEVIWDDVVYRHGGLRKTPEQMLADDPKNFGHCLGNFWGAVYQMLVERGEIKP